MITTLQFAVVPSNSYDGEIRLALGSTANAEAHIADIRIKAVIKDMSFFIIFFTPFLLLISITEKEGESGHMVMKFFEKL